MRIDDIKPYERNARKNEAAVPVVAESIREFGLRGQIVLESRENPVIVAGHTRWAACKSLGWTEIPDERIDYCDDLTEDQIKAYRLADNRTGEVATWNKALLKSEIKALDKSGFDMGRFRFDFKSRHLQYGAERLKTDRAYNLHLVNAYDCNENGMPSLEPVDAKPKELVGFNYAKTASKFDVGIHFFIDDYQFERLWNAPEKYLDLLKRFECVVMPDFSLYLDMPLPMQAWNSYRSKALALWWQRNGVTVIPCPCWADERSYDFVFSGLPSGSTIAVSTVGVKRSEESRGYWFKGMDECLERLEPKRVLLYGGDIGYDFGDVDVVPYTNSVTDRMAGRDEA